MRQIGIFAALIYLLGAVQVVVLLVLGAELAAAPNPDGGREMGLFFFVLMPLVWTLAALALFRFAPWPFLRGVAALTVILPTATWAAYWFSAL